jgi:predicted benzoate:H+ symporter BenE
VNLNRVDLYAALSYVAGGGLAATAVGIATFAPHYQVQILAGSAIVVGISGLLVRLFNNKTGSTPPPDPSTKGP